MGNDPIRLLPYKRIAKAKQVQIAKKLTWYTSAYLEEVIASNLVKMHRTIEVLEECS